VDVAVPTGTSYNKHQPPTQLHPASDLAAQASYAYEYPSQTFEPQVNTPALSAFVIIAVVFSLLQFRINQVRDAGERRQEALAMLRTIKSAQLDSTDFESSMERQTPNEEEVQAALDAYKNSLQEELNLRTIIPGVRIVAPNDPKRREEDIAAAKQFLDWDLADLESEGTISEEKEKEIMDSRTRAQPSSSSSSSSSASSRDELLLQSRRRFDGKNEKKNEVQEGGMSNGAKAVLFSVALVQILLLVVLSFDPMTANNVFTSIGGEPPSDVPLSSWSSI